MNNRPFIKPEDRPLLLYSRAFDSYVPEEALKPLIIKQLKADIIEMEVQVRLALAELRKLKEKTADSIEISLVEARKDRLLAYRDQLKKKLFFINKPHSPADTFFERQFQKAKTVPITQFLTFNKAGFAKCIWHNEKTSSLKYYPQDNRVWCFGCNAGGDVIDVYSQLRGVDFRQAVETLG